MRAITMAALAAFCMLAGCGTLSTISKAVDKAESFTLTQQGIDDVMHGYDAAFLAPAKTYHDLAARNPCTGSDKVTNAGGLCGQPEIVARLQAADKAVEPALTQLQAQFDTCTTDGAAACTGLKALYDTLTTAIAAAEQVAADNGVH